MNVSKRRLAIALIYLCLLALGWLAANWIDRLPHVEFGPASGPLIIGLFVTALVVFAIAAALPFVPGAEIGLGLMMIFGGGVALPVYAAMVLALSLAFTVGRMVPARRIAGFLRYVRFNRAAALVAQLDGLDRSERLSLLMERAPKRIVPTFLRHRYVALALLFNLPGNSVLGGGGGLALVAGMSGVFGWPQFIAVVMIAVAPVPLMFALMV